MPGNPHFGARNRLTLGVGDCTLQTAGGRVRHRITGAGGRLSREQRDKRKSIPDMAGSRHLEFLFVARFSIQCYEFRSPPIFENDAPRGLQHAAESQGARFPGGQKRGSPPTGA